nr:lipoyltransferase [Bacteroides sp.]
MKHLMLPAGFPPRRLPFYLAMEEWAARRLGDVADDLFFMWQVEPTVIFGRNQRIESEVDLDYCRQHNIQFYRRKSGGGCVFADMNNIMMSYITTADDVVTTFARYTGMVAAFLRSLGVEADNTSRNDVLIQGRKVSGNAFYHLPGRCIAHGTMLYDTDLAHMARAITPSRSKLESKGVKSVESRITTIREHLPELPIEEFKRLAVESLTDGQIILSQAQIEEIEAIERPYYDERWIYGSRVASTLSRTMRIEGSGEFHADIDLRGNRIDRVNLSGDFFMLADLDEMILNHLRGIELTPASVMAALEHADPSRAVPGLTREALTELLCN